MNLTEWAGVMVFLAGLVLMGAYSLYPLFGLAVSENTILFGMRISVVLMGIGAAILIIAMVLRRYKEWKKMKEEIPEEDLRP
jgi:hypothetical protein